MPSTPPPVPPGLPAAVAARVAAPGANGAAHPPPIPPALPQVAPVVAASGNGAGDAAGLGDPIWEVASPAESKPRRRNPSDGVGAIILGMAFCLAIIACGGLALALGLKTPPKIPEEEPAAAPIRLSVPLSERVRTPKPKAAPILTAKEREEVRQRNMLQLYQISEAERGRLAGGAQKIDSLVAAKLKEKNIPAAPLCSDGVFLRRVYIDVIGTLPTAQEARNFLKDFDPDKREKLIDRLLQREEYVDFWAMKWSDLLRVKSEFPINLWPNAVQAYHRWIRTSIRENRPYDQFARELLTSSGSNFRAPPVNFYRAVQRKEPKILAHAVALTFMGVRPESWPAERWDKMAVFFSQIGYKGTREWKEEIVFFDQKKPLAAADAAFPDGTSATIVTDQDPREAFADWLITSKNPWFNRAIANRVWSWLLGRGIIHEPDDLRPDNPPSNPELLAYLEQELVAANYDLKKFFRLILLSKTYQASCLPASKDPESARLFAHYPVRGLEAEVLIDAICQVTGTTERYSSPIPEPFTYIPETHRSISLADASITSPFLEMFGRPPRDSGLESERINTMNSAQRLHLLNSTHILKKIQQGPALVAVLRSGRPPQEITEELYLTILSRFPSPEELDTAQGLVTYDVSGSGPGVDIPWALMNSAEFLCRH